MEKKRKELTDSLQTSDFATNDSETKNRSPSGPEGFPPKMSAEIKRD